MISAVSSWRSAFIKFRKGPSIPALGRGVIMKECWILVGVFSHISYKAMTFISIPNFQRSFVLFCFSFLWSILNFTEWFFCVCWDHVVFLPSSVPCSWFTRYKMISEFTWPNHDLPSDKEAVKKLIEQCGFQEDVAYGKTKIFIRTPRTLFTLEELRAQMLLRIVLFLQKVIVHFTDTEEALPVPSQKSVEPFLWFKKCSWWYIFWYLHIPWSAFCYLSHKENLLGCLSSQLFQPQNAGDILSSGV